MTNPEYLHVLLNPLPVYGLAVGVVSLATALVVRSRGSRVTALSIVCLTACSAWPVYRYGEAAYDRVLSMTDDDGGQWLDEHMRRGEQLIYAFYLVAGLAAVALLAEAKFQNAAIPLSIATLLLASATLLAGGYIAYAGGRVRHKEFRTGIPPPAAQHHSDS